jgi:hypothetical protein
MPEAVSAHAIKEKIRVRILPSSTGVDFCLTYCFRNCRELFVDLGLILGNRRLLALHFFCQSNDLLLVAFGFFRRLSALRGDCARKETGTKESEAKFHRRQLIRPL